MSYVHRQQKRSQQLLLLHLCGTLQKKIIIFVVFAFGQNPKWMNSHTTCYRIWYCCECKVHVNNIRRSKRFKIEISPDLKERRWESKTDAF